MKKSYLQYLLAGAALVSLANCSDNNDDVTPVNEELNTQVLMDFSANLPQSVYGDLSAKTATLYDQVVALGTDGATDNELAAARTTWKQARQAWEQSEAFLFGPVSTKDIDPHIDTWPVNFNDLNAQLASDAVFTEDYINNLDDALKGFHPIEYLIFGEDGNKKASDLSERDMEYLTALALNLKALTADANNSWKPTVSGNYHTIFTTAGAGNTTYPTQLAAYQELVNAMAGICDEVANGKLDEPFSQKDPSLEESPFAQNSIIDFTNNIKGVQDVYLGKYNTDGKGLEDIVRQYNLQLDSDLKAKMDNAVTALGKITDPFGKAITTQPTQIESAMTAINDLKDIIKTQLLPFVQQHTK
jgi:putative iron-regulated protein